MKKLNDLLVERTEKIRQMDAILNKATGENRKRTEQESNEWKAASERVNELNAEIEVLERQAELNRTIAGQAPLDKEEKKAVKRYDFVKAVTEARSGILTGLEKEMHDEAAKELRGVSGAIGNLFLPQMFVNRSYLSRDERSKRANEETKTTGASSGWIPTFTEDADMGLVVASPLYRDLGVTVYENLMSGKLEIPFSQGNSASSPNEQSAATQSVPTKTKGTLTAGRIQGWQNFTQESLSEQSVLPSILADMIGAIDRKVGSMVALDAVAVNVMSGFATSDTAAAITYAGLLAQISALTSDMFVNEKFLLSKDLFYFLASKVKESGTADYIVNFLQGNNQGRIGGIQAFGTSFLPLHDSTKYDAIYGDWKQAYVGFWGGVQLLIDPYTGSDSGYVKITFARMGAVDSNPYAFAAKRNISLA